MTDEEKNEEKEFQDSNDDHEEYMAIQDLDRRIQRMQANLEFNVRAFGLSSKHVATAKAQLEQVIQDKQVFEDLRKWQRENR